MKSELKLMFKDEYEFQVSRYSPQTGSDVDGSSALYNATMKGYVSAPAGLPPTIRLLVLILVDAFGPDCFLRFRPPRKRLE